MKVLNSTAQLVEPLLTRKFARFALQYVETEEKPDGQPDWEPRFAGHQSLEEREASFLARDQKINCGFVRGPGGSPSTGFDLGEDDANYISRCHIAVVSCIFGNSDRLRTPANKMVCSSLLKISLSFDLRKPKHDGLKYGVERCPRKSNHLVKLQKHSFKRDNWHGIDDHF